MQTQTKRSISRPLALLLAAFLVLGTVLIPSVKTPAAPAAQSVVVGDMNNLTAAPEYNTGALKGDYVCTFTMPANGTLQLAYKYPSDVSTYPKITDSAGRTISYATTSRQEITQVDGLSATEDHRYYTELVKGQTYTLTISTYSDAYDVIFRLACAANAATLSSGKAIYGGTQSNYVSYYAIKAAKNGYLNVQFQDAVGNSYPSYSIQLLNAKKKPVTHAFERVNSSTGYETTFGVKKGTYYLAVKTSLGNPMYMIKATAKAVTTKAGTKKSKAVTLKKGKTKKGVIYAKNKKTPAKHWYKFKVTKRKKVTLSINTKTSSGSDGLGRLKLLVKPAKGYGSYTGYFSYSKPADKVKLYTIRNANLTLDPGTYYVCVSGDSYGNGYYTLKWK